MIILAGVTVGIALQGGLFEKANEATTKYEKEIILEQIMSMASFNNQGYINVLETFNNVKTSGLNVTDITEETDVSCSFKVKGAKGLYGYKITTTKISSEESEEELENEIVEVDVEIVNAEGTNNISEIEKGTAYTNTFYTIRRI